jgi:hypothetical protein
MPHRHPEDRVYTVISGTFYIGLGEEFDADKLQAYPPGAVIVLPGSVTRWARERVAGGGQRILSACAASADTPNRSCRCGQNTDAFFKG